MKPKEKKEIKAWAIVYKDIVCNSWNPRFKCFSDHIYSRKKEAKKALEIESRAESVVNWKVVPCKITYET